MSNNQAQIHPTALIGEGVSFGAGTQVGPFAVIEDGVVLGAGCRVYSHAVIHRYVRLGAGNRVFPQAVLGGLPQDLGFDPGMETWLEIGDRNVFREGVTVNRATAATGLTRVGSHGFFMSNSHIAHDCRVGDRVIIASNAALGGHVEVGDQAFLGGGAMVHQFCRIGTLTMVSGLAGVRKDVLPYSMLAGEPARHFRLNSIGLRRAGVSGERVRALSRAFRELRQGGYRPGPGPHTPELTRLRDWLAAESKRGLSGFVRGGDKNADG